MKILIADDEKEIRKILRILLESRGHSVTEAANGEEAVDAVTKNGEFDLCIMDIMMPIFSGVDAVQRIRKFSTGFKIFYNIGADIKYYLEVVYEQSRAPQKVGKNV